MAQGFTRNDTAITIKDSANLDSFSRLRVSNPLTIFSKQFTYDIAPLIFEQISFGAAVASWDSSNRLAILSLTGATAGDYVYMQSYEYIPYQPGRSQLVFITFNMFPGSIINSDTERYVGLGDNDNGFFLRWTGTDFEFGIQTTTSTGPQSSIQSNWNLDKLDGTGPSGITIDFRFPQILVIDFQALYVGRVRFGFDIDGEIIYAHEFLNSNTIGISYPYIATANLPIRVGITCRVVGPVSDSMNFICCSVASEGGSEDYQRFGYTFSTGGTKNITTITNPNYLMSLQPLNTFNGITNRIKFVLDDIEFLNLTKEPVRWYLTVGAPINASLPTWNAVDATYSSTAVDFAATPAPPPIGVIIDEGYVPGSSGSTRGTTSSNPTSSRYPITLDAAGNTRDFGTLALWADVLSGTNTDLYFSMKWKEIR